MTTQIRLLEVQLLALAVTITGDLLGSAALTTLGVTVVTLSLLALFGVMASTLATGVSRWVRARPSPLLATRS